MSADEFDPMIERLFAQAPSLPDEALFLATVKARMETRSRWRVPTCLTTISRPCRACIRPFAPAHDTSVRSACFNG